MITLFSSVLLRSDIDRWQSLLLHSTVVRVRAVEHRPLNNAPVGHFTDLLSHGPHPLMLVWQHRPLHHPNIPVAVAVAPMANVFGEKFIGTPCIVAFVSIPMPQRVMCACVRVGWLDRSGAGGFLYSALCSLVYLYANHVLFVSSRLWCPVGLVY